MLELHEDINWVPYDPWGLAWPWRSWVTGTNDAPIRYWTPRGAW